MILRNRNTGETTDAASIGQSGLGAYLAGDWDIVSGSLGELTNDPSVLSGGTSGLIDRFRASEPTGPLSVTNTSTMDSPSGPGGGGSGSMGTIKVKLANGQIQSFPYGSATDGPPLDAALKAGGKVLDADGTPMQMTGGVYQGWIATGADGKPLPLNVVATGTWLPYQKEMMQNYVTAGWRPGQPALTSEPALPSGAAEYYKNYQGQADPYANRTTYNATNPNGGAGGSRQSIAPPIDVNSDSFNRFTVPGFTLRPKNLLLVKRNEDGTTESMESYNYDEIQTKLDEGWRPSDDGGTTLMGDDRVRKSNGGWLIDDRPVNTVVSGLIDPAQRQALIAEGRWHPEWDDPNDPNYISQVPLNDPRHSWTTPGKMWNPATGAFDAYDRNATVGGASGTNMDGTLLEPWLDKFQAPDQYNAKTFDETYTPATFDKKFEFNYDDLANDPGFKFRMDRALKAVERPAAAGGRLMSGRTLGELTDRASGMASDEFSAAYGRKAGEYGMEWDQFNKAEDRNFSNYLTKSGIFDKNEQAKVANSDTAYKRKLGEFGLDYDIFKNNQTDIFNKLNVMSGGGSVASGSLGSLMAQFGRDTSGLFNDQAGAAAGGVAGKNNANQSMLDTAQQIALYKSLGIL